MQPVLYCFHRQAESSAGLSVMNFTSECTYKPGQGCSQLVRKVLFQMSEKASGAPGEPRFLVLPLCVGRALCLEVEDGVLLRS